MVYETNSTVHERIGLVISEYAAYANGSAPDTSTGLRISLLKLASFLFWERPLAGYGDSHYPVLSEIASIASFNTEALEFALIHNGAHNEIMQNVLRSGMFGLASSLLMFTVPAVVFYRGTRSKNPSARAAGLVGLCYIVAVFCFGLTTETFNLKYTISFYALMVSALAAQVLRPQST
jgi:O-antigen ligase